MKDETKVGTDSTAVEVLNSLHTLAIDAGGSGCRVSYIRGSRRYKKDMVARLRMINDGATAIADLEDPTEDFQIMSDHIPSTKGRYVRGSAGQDYKDGVSIQPDNQGLKVNQPITYINALHVIARTLLPLKSNEILDVRAGIVIPAAEFCSDKNLVDIPKEFLSKGIHEVFFPVLKRTVRFKIDKTNVPVGGEGMVYASVIQKDPRYTQLFKTTDGVIVDAGRRSTDITPFKKGKPVKKAARSFPIGGIQLESSVSANLELEGKPVSNDDIIDVIRDGNISGYNVAPMIDRAKKVLAGSIRESVTTVMATAETSTKNQSYVVLVGQPFIEENGVSPTSAHYKGSLAKEVLACFPADIMIIKPDDQEFANCDAMLDLMIAPKKGK